jgi:2-dehydro-3-deoxyphosphogluconate aldolase/(4S)-4-hydroxy-2-oxoglutarate aldolase
LSAIQEPIPDVRFCPTGGITLENAARYLALSNVPFVGGTWIATRALIQGAKWQDIEVNARQTLKELKIAS